MIRPYSSTSQDEKRVSIEKNKTKKIYKNQDDQTLFSKVDVQTLEMLVPLKNPKWANETMPHTNAINKKKRIIQERTEIESPD